MREYSNLKMQFITVFFLCKEKNLTKLNNNNNNNNWSQIATSSEDRNTNI